MQFEDITFLKCPECEKVIKEEKETVDCHNVEKNNTKNNNKTKNKSGLWFSLNEWLWLFTKEIQKLGM